MLRSASDKLYEKLIEEEECHKITSLYVLAPVMSMFVLWVINEALQSQKERLYFLARDGYSMYHVADKICKELKLPIQCKYLHCSRYAWRSAEFNLLGEESLEYICLGGIDVTFKKVMKRAGLSEEEGLEIAELLGKEKEFEMPMAYQQVKALRPVLAGCKPFMDKLKRLGEESYPAVCGYLEQEGLLTDGKWAIADSGWTGSMQKSLRHILESMGYKDKLDGYYFGMYENPSEEDLSGYHPWYFSPKSNIKRKVYFSNSLFECIYSATEGMTLGYVKENGQYVPILEKKESPNMAQIVDSTQLLVLYIEQLITENGMAILSNMEYNGEVAYLLLSLFMGKPMKEEAEYFGNYVFCDDVIGEEAQTIAAHLTKEEIKANRFLYKATNFIRKNGKAVKESAWLEGSIVLCDTISDSEVWHSAFYKYLLYIRKNLK